MPFDSLRVLSLESRRAAEIEILIRKQGGEAFVAPSMRERPNDDHADALRLLDGLEAGRFEMLILMTGVGLAFWRDAIAERFDLARATKALRRCKLLCRGPKPVAVLRGMGITPDITVPEPNTWREIVETLRPRPERSFALQEYGKPNHELVAALRGLHAVVEKFALYKWELPENLAPLEQAVDGLANGRFDVVLFTSSVQLEHLLEIAERSGLREEVLHTLRERAVVASVGPVMSDTLAEHGIGVDVSPESPKMGPLVALAAEKAKQLLQAKRKLAATY